MPPLVRATALTKRFTPGLPPALDAISIDIAPGRVTGLVGPDGAGKTTLLRLFSGLLKADSGTLEVCGLDPVAAGPALHRKLAYMPQHFGLYEDLTVSENLQLYADLRALPVADRPSTIARLLSFTGLEPFMARLAGQLSGGMKQKLGLACSLIVKPDLLLLDEPSVGVDPISRRELWRMVYDMVDQGIGVVWSTAYLDEAERCAEVILLSEGRVLYQGPPHDLTLRAAGRSFLVRAMAGDRRKVLTRALDHPDVIDGTIQGQSLRLVLKEEATPPTADQIGAGADTVIAATPPRFEDVFMDLLGGGPKIRSPFADAVPKTGTLGQDVVVADRLTRRFAKFTAAENISFSVRRGEIFGLIGPNGAGKSTTFKMLNGLLKPSSGTALVAGLDLGRAAGEARARLGYMAQKFSLYGDLSVRQNLNFFAGVYGLGGGARREAIAQMVETFALGPHLGRDAGSLPLGFRQRLALACAVIHAPDVLFLDEPTSGVDPRARREFWAHMNAMVATGVTIMVTTHFLDEAEYCDRVALIYRGHMIALGTPDALKAAAVTPDLAEPTLEDAFIALVQADDARQAAA